MTPQVPWWSVLVAYAGGWLIGRLDRESQDHPRRRFNHENTNRPGGPPPLKLRRSTPDPPEQFIRMDPGPIQRGNGSGGPTTPKPQIVPKGQRARHEYINNPPPLEP